MFDLCIASHLIIYLFFYLVIELLKLLKTNKN